MLPDITERLEFIETPAHAAAPAQYRAISRPFSGFLVLGERGLRTPAAGTTRSRRNDQPGLRRYSLPEDGEWRG